MSSKLKIQSNSVRGLTSHLKMSEGKQVEDVVNELHRH
jgi:hypothetical protein